MFTDLTKVTYLGNDQTDAQSDASSRALPRKHNALCKFKSPQSITSTYILKTHSYGRDIPGKAGLHSFFFPRSIYKLWSVKSQTLL